MASLSDSEDAIARLAGMLAGADGVRTQLPDRTVSCRLTDLDETISGRLTRGELVDITTRPQPPADVRLTMTSDDLIELVEGRLDLVHAWGTGRLKVAAPLRDLLRLRNLV